MAGAETHWKKLQNRDYLGSWDLSPDEERILTIQKVGKEMVFNPSSNSKEECTVARFDGAKPMILNTTNCQAIEKLHKTPYVEDWVGKQICIHSSKVKAFGTIVDALRVMTYLPKKEGIKCEKCKKAIVGFGEMSASQFAQKTMDSYGKKLCIECATEAKKSKDSELNGDK